jgi:hypothetical protein
MSDEEIHPLGLRELSVLPERLHALYVSDEWGLVRQSLPAHSRTEVALALRAVASVAYSMALSLEDVSGYPDGEGRGSNYGVPR